MKQVYFFGAGKADGQSSDSKLLGGKGANLAEMTNIGLPVPPGFTITTECCIYYLKKKQIPPQLIKDVNEAIIKIEKTMKYQFGGLQSPLLLSIRSGARQSMPGMMETVLNVGLTSKTIPGLIQLFQDEQFVYDAYRRLIMMYADVVMEKSEGIIVKRGELSIRQELELILEDLKNKHHIKEDSELSVKQLKTLCLLFKKKIKLKLGTAFPDNPKKQLWGAIEAVFKSWNGKRAIHYRKIENIPNHWGTAVNVQAMVFGNLGKKSGTGVAFTRNPSTGVNKFYGEWLINAQGEDVVAGIRTPNPINNHSKNKESSNLPSLESKFPKVYSKLIKIKNILENHFGDMQDIEFTFQNNNLWMLQTRKGKRNGHAALKISMDMLNKNLISESEAINRVSTKNLEEIMHPMINPKDEKNHSILASGLPAGPGGACGQIVLDADSAEILNNQGYPVILIRNETSPEDIHGMHASQGILTAKGGMTSHAALVARGWGKCCIVGCSRIIIDVENKSVNINGTILKEGDWISLNGSTGNIYQGKIHLINPNLKKNKIFSDFMKLCDKHRTIKIRTNVDTPEDAQQALDFQCEGIGLCRTEHMFFDPDRISAMREMILSKNAKYRKQALMKLLPYQKKDFYNLLKVMSGLPVTIRLLDPPLHEFLPQTEEQILHLASEMGITSKTIYDRIDALHELNPMLGHRGCRLGIVYPEITIMQAQAIFEACSDLITEGFNPIPEIMVPLVGTENELADQKKVIIKKAKQIEKKNKININYLIGTMIELPRACINADMIAKEADFFSFGTNDLTQTTFGFSRDDIGSFIPSYLEKNILTDDPFQTIDINGVGELLKIAIKKGRTINPKIKIGICGEHGGDSKSVKFFDQINLDYVSCSPFRIPIAKLAAAQSAI